MNLIPTINPANAQAGITQGITPQVSALNNYLANLLRRAGEQPWHVATNVRNLIQGLIGTVQGVTY